MNRLNDYTPVFRWKEDAIAYVSGIQGYPDIQGRVLFYQLRTGVMVRADIVGLPVGEGPCRRDIFAFHIHTGETCENSGSHFDTDNCPHPYHLGDLPPLFGNNGTAFMCVLTDRFNVGEVIGKTVIIHAKADDFTTQPSGDPGEKIACGVIDRARR